MNNQGLLSLAQFIMPSEILSYFEVTGLEEDSSFIRIYLDEAVKVEYKFNPDIESKGFYDAVTIKDFLIRNKGVNLIVRRRRWYDKEKNRYLSDTYSLKAEGPRGSKVFAFFKECMETIPSTSRTRDRYYHINGDTFEKQYKEILSSYREWSELTHADEWLVFP